MARTKPKVFKDIRWRLDLLRKYYADMTDDATANELEPIAFQLWEALSERTLTEEDYLPHLHRHHHLMLSMVDIEREWNRKNPMRQTAQAHKLNAHLLNLIKNQNGKI